MDIKKLAWEHFITMTIIKTFALCIPTFYTGLLISVIGWNVATMFIIAIILVGAVVSVGMDFEEYKATIEEVDYQEEES